MSAEELHRRLRARLGDEELRAAGAEHLQIGRHYPWEQRLQPGVRRLMRAVKHSLDPDGPMAPGVLFDSKMASGDGP